MGDFYIKPGNQERGWNDPPQFSYDLQTSTGAPKQNILNKRLPPPQTTDHKAGSGLPPNPVNNSVTPSKSMPPVAGFTPLPKSHISLGKVTDSHPCPSKLQSESSVQLGSEPNLIDVQAPLYWALTACRQTVKKQVCDDVERRLKIFEEMWTNGKLSNPVKYRIYSLSQELSNKNWDKADEIHRSLMVDYINEVSQWMVGVKRLISEARNLNPELLQRE